MVTAIKGEKKLKSAGLQPERRKKTQRQKDKKTCFRRTRTPSGRQ